MALGSTLGLSCTNEKNDVNAPTSGGTTGTSEDEAPLGGNRAATAGSSNIGGGNVGGAALPSGGAADSPGVAGAGAPAAGGRDEGGRAGTSGASSTSDVAGRAGAEGAAWSAEFPDFTRHEIASFSSGYALCTADIDGDEQLDVVALSAGSAGLVWFKNPSWERFTIMTGLRQLIHLAPYDIDQDGDVDLALISDFDMNDSMQGGTVSWAEAPDDPTTSQSWAIHPIGAVPTSHRLRFADINGDGRKELINLPLFGVGSSAPTRAGFVELTAYSIPPDPKGAWTARVLDDEHLEVSHALEIVDWDGDAADDILTAANAGITLFRPALTTEATRLGAGKEGQAPNRGSSEVALGRLGDARFIASIEPWHGTDAVIYTPGAAESDAWTRETIGSDFQNGHAMVAADLNADGYDEVIAGGSQGSRALLIYRYVPSAGAWEKIELDDGGVAVSGIEVKDMNGDGALDIVAIGGSPTNNIVWYESSR